MEKEDWDRLSAIRCEVQRLAGKHCNEVDPDSIIPDEDFWWDVCICVDEDGDLTGRLGGATDESEPFVRVSWNARAKRVYPDDNSKFLIVQSDCDDEFFEQLWIDGFAGGGGGRRRQRVFGPTD